MVCSCMSRYPAIAISPIRNTSMRRLKEEAGAAEQAHAIKAALVAGLERRVEVRRGQCGVVWFGLVGGWWLVGVW